MDTLWPILSHPFTWGLALGLLIAGFVLKNGLTSKAHQSQEIKRLKDELDQLQKHLNTHLKITATGNDRLEKDLASPAESTIFSAHPAVLARADAVHFTCEALGMLVDGTMRADDFEMVLGAHLDTHLDEQSKPSMALLKVGDSLPGLGIVAAVLGIVITMAAISGPIEEIGHKVAAALVGTFLGIFLSYGFMSPLAVNMEFICAAEMAYTRCIAAAINSFANGMAPIMAVEVARRGLSSDVRPSSDELEAMMKALNAPAK
jgi:chemotaxis protein MotA